MIGDTVNVVIDRPLGSAHPAYPDMIYPVNYGYVPGVPAADGEEQDVYVLGVNMPLHTFTGRVIAVIRRLNDVEDKWVAAPEGMSFSRDEIRRQVAFTEKYFRSEILMKPDEAGRGLPVLFGTPGDIGSWMELVRRISPELPGLETKRLLAEHRKTVLRFMRENRALCVKESGSVAGVLLFSRKHSMICCLAVHPDHRGRGIASALMARALAELETARPVTVSTFRENDPKGTAPRALYRKFGFEERELTVEFGYPSQVFVLPSCSK